MHGFGKQVVLAHTPFRRLAVAEKLRYRPVVVAGVGDPAGVAAHYGFQQVLQDSLLPCIVGNCYSRSSAV